MPARLAAIADGLLAAIICEGEVAGGDFTAATRELLQWDDARLERLVGGLVDQTGASSFLVDSANVESLVMLDMQLAKKVRPGFFVAVAAPRDVQFGLSRMWQSLAEVTAWEIHVVRDRAEALDWMRARASQKFNVQFPAEIQL